MASTTTPEPIKELAGKPQNRNLVAEKTAKEFWL